MRRVLVAAIMAFVLTGSVSLGETYRIDGDSTAQNPDGLSWPQAYAHPNDLLVLGTVVSGDELWIAQGTYFTDSQGGTGDTCEVCSFNLIPGIALYGGFQGYPVNETTLDERDWEAHVTVLTGNINHNDDPDFEDGIAALHVITAKMPWVDDEFGVEGGVIVDGFTIEGGRADEPTQEDKDAFGGAVSIKALVNTDSSLAGVAEFRNCIFQNNYAFERGGAIANDRGQITLINCLFENNTADLFDGGAIYTIGADIGFDFAGFATFGEATIVNCQFISNVADSFGGGVYVGNTDATITNSLFWNNSLLDDPNKVLGGAALTFECDDQTGCNATTPTITNCTFVGNHADTSTNARAGGVLSRMNCLPASGGSVLTNCIFWGNTDGSSNSLQDKNLFHEDPAGSGCSESSVPPTVTSSCIEGWESSGDYPATSNIADDPQFVDETNGDLHLAYAAGVPSKCMNAGDDSAVPADVYDMDGDSDSTEGTPDLDLYSRIAGTAVDMGPYEYRVVYVDHDVVTSGDGSNWANAYKELRDGLAFANQWPAEVWVAQYQGDYKPAAGADRTASFDLAEGVRVYGGFDGTETSFSARDVSSKQALLSGDIDASGTADSFHVVTAIGTSQTPITRATILSGFIVKRGNANGSGDDAKGGGMLISGESSPAISDCLFQVNSATSGGGVGIAGVTTADPLLMDVAFSGNSATGNGGGLYNEASEVVLRRCGFKDNSAAGNGGGVYHTNGAAPWTSLCVFDGNDAVNGGGIYNDSNTDVKYFWANAFYGNAATGNGGGLYNKTTDLDMISCLFSGNGAINGGGTYFEGGTLVNVVNCTYASNIADNGLGTLGRGGGIYISTGTPNIDNAVLWGNSSAQGIDEQEDQLYGGSPTVNYSCVQGWSSGGTGNIASNPKFIDPNGVDNTIGTPDDNLRLRATSPASPCIDVGTGTPLPSGESGVLDLDNTPRVADGDCDLTVIVDMGSYEHNPTSAQCP